MTTQGIRGSARARATVVAMVLVAVALPVVGNLPVFSNVVWVFWIAALILIVGALIGVLTVVARTRPPRRSSKDS